MSSNRLYKKYFKNYVYTNDKYPKTSYMAITYDENDKLMYNTKYKDAGGNWDQSTKYLTNVTISMKDKKITIKGAPSEDQQVSTIVFNVEGSSLVDQNGDSYTWKNMSPNQFESGTSDSQTEQQDNDSKFSATRKEEIKQLRDLITSSHGDNSKVSDDQLSKLIDQESSNEDDGGAIYRALLKAYPQVGGSYDDSNVTDNSNSSSSTKSDSPSGNYTKGTPIEVQGTWKNTIDMAGSKTTLKWVITSNESSMEGNDPFIMKNVSYQSLGDHKYIIKGTDAVYGNQPDTITVQVCGNVLHIFQGDSASAQDWQR